ncbi:polysaccharide lyase family 1 protein [Favolaschia claudopus]|uniref:pectin lyase n=1 Tax=Favolaschia claudopus TaxID=2862362 RepID=A0AAW0CU79_9AGAR
MQLRPNFASLLATVSLLPSVLAVGTPFGLGSATTGGGSAAAATPTSLSQLTTWLSDSTARTIVLDRLWDFTGIEGTTTGSGCKPWTCSPNPQITIDKDSWCENFQPNAAKTTVTYDNAGLNPLRVGNNKTLLGKGSGSGIQGKGLYLKGSNNVIIQNIKIVNINPQFVWGGDAIAIDGGSNIWIDHNFIQNIGRQFIATGYGAVSKTTISNNVFDGDTTWSPNCNGQAYWAFIFTGAGDQLTFALNHVYHTSGRGPHVGGTSGFFQNVHVFNNYYDHINGHAIEPDVGSKILLEGNYFNTVTSPDLAGDGQLYVPTSSSTACQSTLGRSCVANTLNGSGALVDVSDTGVLNGITAAYSAGATVMSAQDAANYVQSHAGVGIVN